MLKIYTLTRAFPREELFGLTSQLRRAAVSVPANIAEGYTRSGINDKLRFYNYAHSSLEECRYYLILTRDLSFAETDELLKETEIISKTLGKYKAAIIVNTTKGC